MKILELSSLNFLPILSQVKDKEWVSAELRWIWQTMWYYQYENYNTDENLWDTMNKKYTLVDYDLKKKWAIIKDNETSLFYKGNYSTSTRVNANSIFINVTPILKEIVVYENT